MIERWKFGINNDYLVDLVLKGKKKATTSLYSLDNISLVGDKSIIVFSNNKDACLIETKRVIVTKFIDVSLELALLEGETDNLLEWQSMHRNYFKTIDEAFSDDSLVIFEIFEVIERY